MIFVPPGYVPISHAGHPVARHLFPDAAADAPDDEVMAMTKRCQHFIRGLLFERRLIAFFHDQSPNADQMHPLREIPSGFWLNDISDISLVRGTYFYGEGLSSQIWLCAGAIEAVLNQTQEASDTPMPPAGGRPRKADAALAAYDAIYPQGHEATGETWKQVIAKVTAKAGRAVSIGTLKAAIKDR